MAKEPILEIQDLRTTFNQAGGLVVAVDGISFRLFPGETLGIVGESGSGKSVTALSLLRLTDFMAGAQIERGAIHFSNGTGPSRNLLDLTPVELRKIRGKEIAMIFQEPMTSLNPVFRCGDQIAESLKLHLGLDKEAARRQTMEWLERVRIPEAERAYAAYPHQLSGGQKQRIMIAMAMACHPKVLIADEPTTALDVTIQRQVLDLMQDLKETYGTALIFISHDLGVIAEVADRVLVMQDGKIVEEGSAETLFNSPRHPYTRALLACRPPLDRRLRRLPLLSDFVDDRQPSDVYKALEWPAHLVQERLDKLQRDAPILEVRELTTWYGTPGKGGVKAVDHVSFDVFPGETLGLVGESGSGKTTLGRTILGLVPATAGTIGFEDQDITDWRTHRTKFQMIFQDPYASLNPRIPVGRAVGEALRMHKPTVKKDALKEEVILWLERVGLEAEHYNRYPHQFSGGQRQRICIARALVVQPRFLVCDECVSALDVSIQAQILNLLIDLREAYAFTCIFISHDLSVVKFMSDRMMVMQAGKIVETGPADAVYHQPKEAYTKRLIAALPGQ